MSNVTVRRRKGGEDSAAPATAAPADDGEDDKKAQAPRRRQQAPTVAENIERWGYALGTCGRFFTALYELVIAFGLWVCPLCAREEKRLFQ